MPRIQRPGTSPSPTANDDDAEVAPESGRDDRGERTVHRSPAYPFVSLPIAIERVKRIYDAERQHPVRYDTIAKHWGIAAKSSTVAQTVGALRQYGLLGVKSGERRDRYFQLTDAAVRILADKRDGERERLLREAALSPKLYNDLWTKWGQHPPSDDTAESLLTFELKFNPAYVKAILANYKATVSMARLAESDKVDPGSIEDRDQEGDEGQVETTEVMAREKSRDAPALTGEQEIFRTNLAGGRAARVLFRGPPPTQAQIAKLIKLLELAKDEYPKDDATTV
jgi:hypothetical protein